MNHKIMGWGSVLVVLAAITLVYWPVLKGEFVWDDLIDFVNNPGWLVVGDGWKHYIFRDFHGWTSYFRPLVVAMFTLQVRVFDVQPGPMHAVSLCIHLINTLLIGLLARYGCKVTARNDRTTTILVIVCMLAFGLHPAMIEPVAWIACQFELTATLFMLLGLLASAAIRGLVLRPIVVAACFFLAACSKESAISFPLMLIIFDWIAQSRRGAAAPVRPTMVDFIRRNAPTYATVFVAGLGYLAFRNWGLAQGAIPLHDAAPSILARLQVASHTYWSYWRMLFVPTYRMGPVHEYDMLDYIQVTPILMLMNVAAIGLILITLYFALLRASALAGIVLMLTVNLIPVLHLLPTGFDPSLYHERYIMTGLASVCAMLPLVRWRTHFAGSYALKTGGALLVLAWALASATVIRATLPLWGNSLSLWRWAVELEPKSDFANGWLLATYLRHGMKKEANLFADEIIEKDLPCTSCLINIAMMRIDQKRLEEAEEAIQKIRKAHEITTNEIKFGFYMTAVGHLLMAQGQYADAESAYRSSLRALPADPNSWFQLARSLAAQGRDKEAREAVDNGLAMIPAEFREATRQIKEHEIGEWFGKASKPAVVP